MKQKLLMILLAIALALPLTACGDIGVISGPDGPTSVTVSGPGLDGPAQVDLPAQPESEPESDPEPSQPAPDEPTSSETLPEEPVLDEDGTYNSVEDVSLYLYTYDHLPDNYITKNEARDLGWTGGSVEQVAPGYAIGGDRFGNREGLLPAAKGRSYYECDIDTIGEDSRGAKRIVFSNDGLIYYTDDHYETFTLLYGEE